MLKSRGKSTSVPGTYVVIRKAYKYRLKTDLTTATTLSRYAGCCRFVWNKALALQKDRLDQGERCLSYNKLAVLLPAWKAEFPFLKEVHSQPVQQTLMNLDRAIKDAFDKSSPKRFPVFKKKGISTDSFRYPQGFKLAGSRIFLPKIGWFGFFKSREIEGTLRNVTVSRKGQHWFVSIQTEMEVATPAHPATTAVGGDRGVKRFLTLSDGTYYEPLNAFRKLERQLAKEQRKLARKTKKSRNYQKQKAKITKLHIRIADTRRDYLHKVSTEVSKNHAVVVLEDLEVANMSKSATGTIEEPGRQVCQKSGLNKTILDQGWSELQRQLEYKQQWRGGLVLLVNPAYTSLQCSCCGHTAKGNRSSQERFACTACGFEANADHNAAINIKRAGHAQLACQANGAAMPSATGTAKEAA
jgi:putative transposase